MDKLKEQLAPVQKHGFWILCGVILCVSLFSWWRATSNIKTEHERFKADIETRINGVKSIPRDHPNENTNKGMDAEVQKGGEDVARAWGVLAAAQELVLVWPQGVFGPEFISAVNPLRPPELKVTGAITDELHQDFRREARNRYEEVVPNLAKIIKSKWTGKLSGGGGGMGGMGGMGAGMPGGAGGPGGLGGAMAGGVEGAIQGLEGQSPEDDGTIVVWSNSNQSDLMSTHFGFIASDVVLPNTLQILYAQEDYWVLENVMNIIKATNGDITQRHEAAIKYIDYVRIGRSAIAGGGKITGSASGGGAGGVDSLGEGMPGMGGGMGGGMPGMGGGMGGGMPGAGGAGGAMPGGEGAEGGASGGMGGMPGMPGGAGGSGGSSNPTDNRYVDRDHKPLESKRLIAAMKGQPQKPEDLLLAVAKRVPVRMSFRMDQRKVPTLLAECGNSKLPVEVKQVRVNRQGSGGGLGGEGDSGGGQGGMSGMMGNMMGGATGGDEEAGGGAFGGFGGGGTGATNSNRSKVASSNVDPYEISVEIYGIVYIYNPVNREVLGLKPPEGPPSVTPTPTPTSTTPPAAPVTPPANTGAAATGPAAVSPTVN